MSGLVTAGVLLCGVHIVNAQTNIDSGYTVLIPSEVTIDKESGKGSFSVSGKMYAQTELDVTTTSQNNYKLKCGSQFVDYTLDKQSFHIDNIKSANPKSFNEDFNITLTNTNTNYSGPYEDRLTFNIQCHKYTYELDMNSILDGKVEYGSHKFGSVDIYINGEKVADDVSDFNRNYPYGTEFEFKDLKGTDGHHYSGVGSFNNAPPIPLKGKIGIDAYYSPRSNPPYTFCTPCYFKFDTNKLTINYHADGATKLLDWSTKPESYKDISGVDIFHSTTNVYGTAYSNGAGGLTDVDRLSGKQGYKVLSGYWKINKNGEQKYSDNIGFKNTEDCAEYLGVLNELNKNDVTVDLYPIWIPNTYTLTYILDGGSFNASTTQLFKYGSGDAISSEIPIKTGYVFTGWRFNEVVMQPGDKIPNNWGNFTLTAQWEKIYSMGTTLNIDGAEYMVVERKNTNKFLVTSKNSVRNMGYQHDSRDDGLNKNTYEDSSVDKYLENEWYANLSEKMKSAIEISSIKQVSYSTFDKSSKQENGPDEQVYNTIKRHVYLPSVEELNMFIDLDNPTKVKDYLDGNSILIRDSYQPRTDYMMVLYTNTGALNQGATHNEDDYYVRPAFVIDLSKVDYTVTGTVNYK